MRRILLTGFTPWGRFRTNPSGEVAEALGGQVLPVDYRRADALLRRLLLEKPSAVVLTGLAAKRTSIQIESRAWNLDREGLRRPRPIDPAGPRFRKSTLPVAALLRRLRAAGLPADVSHDAGGYLCNHVFYVARGILGRVPCGFIHLPPAEVVPLRRQIQALRMTLDLLGAAP